MHKPDKQIYSQVLKFGLGKIRFHGARFCFYYMFKLNISGHNKIWGGAKNKGKLPRGYGPSDTLTCMMTRLRTT